jgi:hypothetical protein
MVAVPANNNEVERLVAVTELVCTAREEAVIAIKRFVYTICVDATGPTKELACMRSEEIVLV